MAYELQGREDNERRALLWIVLFFEMCCECMILLTNTHHFAFRHLRYYFWQCFLLQKGLIDFVRKLRCHKCIRNVRSGALVFVPLEINGTPSKSHFSPFFPCGELSRYDTTGIRKNKFFLVSHAESRDSLWPIGRTFDLSSTPSPTTRTMRLDTQKGDF